MTAKWTMAHAMTFAAVLGFVAWALGKNGAFWALVLLFVLWAAS